GGSHLCSVIQQQSDHGEIVLDASVRQWPRASLGVRGVDLCATLDEVERDLAIAAPGGVVQRSCPDRIRSVDVGSVRNLHLDAIEVAGLYRVVEVGRGKGADGGQRQAGQPEALSSTHPRTEPPPPLRYRSARALAV